MGYSIYTDESLCPFGSYVGTPLHLIPDAYFVDYLESVKNDKLTRNTISWKMRAYARKRVRIVDIEKRKKINAKKKKLSVIYKGCKNKSDEHKKKISESLKKYWRTKESSEHKRKLFKNWHSKKHENYSKYYDLKNDDL